MVCTGAPIMAVASLMAPRVIDDEAELVVRAQHDRQHFAPLYRAYLPDVYRFCYRRLGNRQAAEDATSQVFVQALAALPRYQSGSFRGWLFTIAYHVVIDETRRRRPSSHLDAALDIAAPGPDIEEQVIRANEGQKLAQAMARLPAAQRQVLELRLAGLTAVEIAQVLGRSHGAIRNLQHRTLVKLRELLDVPAAGRGVRGVS